MNNPGAITILSMMGVYALNPEISVSRGTILSYHGKEQKARRRKKKEERQRRKRGG